LVHEWTILKLHIAASKLTVALGYYPLLFAEVTFRITAGREILERDKRSAS
jgi:hypothetical protein